MSRHHNLEIIACEANGQVLNAVIINLAKSVFTVTGV